MDSYHGYICWNNTNIGFSDEGGSNIGIEEELLLKVQTGFKVVHEFLITERLKESQFVLDGGSIISKIIETEMKSNVQFEYVHVKTKQNNE